MYLEEGCFVFIKYTSFAECQQIAHGDLPPKATRPFYLSLQNPKDKDIFWAIPVSSRIERCKELAITSPCKYKFYKFLNRDTCFNISRMIPIVEDDIQCLYLNKNGSPTGMSRKDRRALSRYARNIYDDKPERWEHIMSGINVRELYKRAQRKLGRQ